MSFLQSLHCSLLSFNIISNVGAFSSFLYLALRLWSTIRYGELQFAAEDTAPATVVITGTALVRYPVSYTKTSFDLAPRLSFTVLGLEIRASFLGNKSQLGLFHRLLPLRLGTSWAERTQPRWEE